jgi:isopentenyldiphosphate isomerase
VHVWLVIPRTGALLLRRYAPDALKHPGRWGPTVHGEILCYGTEGNGHAAEGSAQAAARSINEQLGIDANEVDALEHCFSCQSYDGSCVEILDVYIAALKGQGLPALNLHPHEEVNWAFFADVFSEDAKRAGTVFQVEEDYIMSMMRRLRVKVVANDVLHAFGPQAAKTLDRDEVRGFSAAGGTLEIHNKNSWRNRVTERAR